MGFTEHQGSQNTCENALILPVPCQIPPEPQVIVLAIFCRGSEKMTYVEWFIRFNQITKSLYELEIKILSAKCTHG